MPKPDDDNLPDPHSLADEQDELGWTSRVEEGGALSAFDDDDPGRPRMRDFAAPDDAVSTELYEPDEDEVT
jgi:hypothetical protein